jgi:hypothetical protein
MPREQPVDSRFAGRCRAIPFIGIYPALNLPLKALFKGQLSVLKERREEA